MIIVFCIALALLLRLATRNPMREMQHMRIVGEYVLLALLVAQLLLPVLRLTGSAAGVAYWAWLATLPLLVGIAWRNRRQPGFVVLALGLLMNFVVIALNEGMPVSPDAVSILSSASVSRAISPGDFVHVVVSATTRFPWLADILPIPGPAWFKAVASPGDCLLFVGIAAYLSSASSGAESLRSAGI
jgi:hypothetical protein